VGKIVDYLAGNQDYYDAVVDTARRQYRRRSRAYNSLSLFEACDLEQELWVALLEREVTGYPIHLFTRNTDDFKDFLISLAEVIGTKGRRKAKEGDELPISQFPEDKRHELENRYYSNSGSKED